jgi:hypothetical protein
VAASDIVPVTGEWFEETLAEASPDMLRTMVRSDTARDGMAPGSGGHVGSSVSKQR